MVVGRKFGDRMVRFSDYNGGLLHFYSLFVGVPVSRLQADSTYVHKSFRDVWKSRTPRLTNFS